MRAYRYVGPAELRDPSAPPGTIIDSAAALRAWWMARDDDDESIATFAVTTDGQLHVAPRRSEHVVCAGSDEVLAAGELGFEDGSASIVVVYASNQSTGFCPSLASWEALAAALDRAGISRPRAWTAAFEFRRCLTCAERNIVKDGWLDCAMCGAELPDEYNF